MSLGDRLKEVRAGKTQKELAALMGVSTNTYAMYERNEHSPDAKFLEAICRKFEIKPAWLLLGDGQKTDVESLVLTKEGGPPLSEEDLNYLARLIDLVYEILTLGGQQQLTDSKQLIVIVTLFCKLFFHEPDRIDLLHRFSDGSIERARVLLDEIASKSKR